MKAVVLLCEPGARFHLGKYAPDRDTDTALADTDQIIHSDTLFSALVNIWQDSIGNADELVDIFKNNQLTISSCFHCLSANNQYIWFLPKPVSFNLFPVPEGTDPKILRKVDYISASLWAYLQNPGTLMDDNEVVIISTHYALLRTELAALFTSGPALSDERLKQLKITSIETLPKVEVRNDLPDSRIYQFSVVEIADNSAIYPDLKVHFYFLLDTKDTISEASYEKLLFCLNLLPLHGIGAERSTIGQLSGISIYDNWNISLTNPHQTKACCISLFNSQNGEDSFLGKLILRGGRRLGANNRKYLRSVRMLQEGAIIEKNATGQLVSISPDTETRPYLRNGIAFTLPIHQNWIN